MLDAQPAPVGGSLPRGHLLVLNRSFRRTLEAENKSPRTIGPTPTPSSCSSPQLPPVLAFSRPAGPVVIVGGAAGAGCGCAALDGAGKATGPGPPRLAGAWPRKAGGRPLRRGGAVAASGRAPVARTAGACWPGGYPRR